MDGIIGTGGRAVASGRLAIVSVDAFPSAPCVEKIRGTGFEVDTFAGLAAIGTLVSSPPDLILVDARRAFWVGLQVCRAIRETPRLSHMPMLLWSDALDEERRVQAYEAGIDEIIARDRLKQSDALKIAAIARRRASPSRFLSYADLQLDLEGYRVRRAGKAVPLSVNQLRLLRLFIENPERVLTKQQIAEVLWGRADVEDETVRGSVQRLRKTLRSGFGSETIRCVKGGGYALDLSLGTPALRLPLAEGDVANP